MPAERKSRFGKLPRIWLHRKPIYVALPVAGRGSGSLSDPDLIAQLATGIPQEEGDYVNQLVSRITLRTRQIFYWRLANHTFRHIAKELKADQAAGPPEYPRRSARTVEVLPSWRSHHPEELVPTHAGRENANSSCSCMARRCSVRVSPSTLHSRMSAERLLLWRSNHRRIFASVEGEGFLAGLGIVDRRQGDRKAGFWRT